MDQRLDEGRRGRTVWSRWLQHQRDDRKGGPDGDIAWDWGKNRVERLHHAVGIVKRRVLMLGVKLVSVVRFAVTVGEQLEMPMLLCLMDVRSWR
jgi:hypothetical protein